MGAAVTVVGGAGAAPNASSSAEPLRLHHAGPGVVLVA